MFLVSVVSLYDTTTNGMVHRKTAPTVWKIGQVPLI